MKKSVFVFLSVLLCVPLFTACSSAGKHDIGGIIDDTYHTLLDPYNENWLVSLSKEQIAEQLNIAAEAYESATVYASEDKTRAAVLGGFIAKDGKVETLAALLREFVESRTAKFNGYLPDQYKIAKNAVVKSYDNYVFLVMTDQNNAVLEHLNELINSRSDFIVSASSD